MRRGLLLLLACVCAALLLTAAAAPAKRTDSDCTWGASSVISTQVDGRWEQSEPATTGCVPG